MRGALPGNTDRIDAPLALSANESRAIATAAIALAALLLGELAGRLVSRRGADDYGRYQLRRTVRYALALAGLVAIAILWRGFATRASLFAGLFVAGLAFALQEVVGAIAGWFNILSGHIFRVGDRIEMAGVRGDVIDLTPLRTKILEMGGPPDVGTSSDEPTSWVHGRQHTGRIVAISNKATFTDPVYNYSAIFDYIWEELTLPVPFRCDWRRAEQILREEAEQVSHTKGAEEAIEEMTPRYPVPKADVEPKVFARATDNWMELAARFVVSVRSARAVKSELTHRVLDRFDAEGIQIASGTLDVTVRGPDGGSGFIEREPARPR